MSRSTKKMAASSLTAVLIFLLAAPAMADLPGPGPRPHPPRPRPVRPDPVKPDAVPIVIRVDPQAKDSVLRIPKQFLPSAKVGAAEEQQPANPGSLRHVIAAIALSGAITGLFFVRRDRKTRAAVVVVVCVCAVAAAGTLMANAPAPAPRDARPELNLPGPLVNQPAASPNQTNVRSPLLNGVDGNVIIQITDGGTAVNLIIGGKLATNTGIAPPTAGVSAPAPASKTAPNPSP